MTIAPPNWAKDATPQVNGWYSPSGEKLKSQKISIEDMNEYLGIGEPVTIPMAEAQTMVEVPEMLVEEEAPDYSNMTKLELEQHGRTMGIELDRRKSKADLINTLNEG